MVTYCCVHGCNSSTYYKKGKKENKNRLQFFGIPSNPVIKKRWTEALLAAGYNKEHMAKIKKFSKICSLHFTKDCIEKIGLSYGRLKENSVPTIFPCNNALTASMADKSTLPNMPLVQMDVRQREETNNETVSVKRMCYAGDINVEEVKSMSLTTIAKSMSILKRTCEKKNIVINRLRVQVHRQKRKVEILETLLNELQTKSLLSSTSSDIIQI